MVRGSRTTCTRSATRWAIGTYGFTCSDLTCTMVDGSQWTLSDAGSGGTYFNVGLAAAAG